MSWTAMLFSGKGRIGRRDYWIWSLSLALAAGITLRLIVSWVQAHTHYAETETTAFVPLAAGLLVVGLYVFMSSCVAAKRWHDREKSGWLAGLVYVPLIGAVALLWHLIECGFAQGTPGPNRYGPSPKGVNDPEQVFE
ncbi:MULTISPECIES: DUF805 domain-containing protein [Asticcacaulis]|uniref:DUF805 domain-containing protein n=1 Tax=Asticcacaulis TaxID=76890 RepID=UPI001AE46F8A|nr:MULTISPECIES: DUF805 domain-containing protein [Asticcacaulis]MBP2160248.1 uncharacterized membrane protein YhaH (DUF805 family) [Asticcacaulis solisilvae]MDR6801449.1 uncharacterized membrane protein YhaH (DUF805 family) [Asticcacaulis sp. BE141]